VFIILIYIRTLVGVWVCGCVPLHGMNIGMFVGVGCVPLHGMNFETAVPKLTKFSVNVHVHPTIYIGLFLTGSGSGGHTSRPNISAIIAYIHDDFTVVRVACIGFID